MSVSQSALNAVPEPDEIARLPAAEPRSVYAAWLKRGFDLVAVFLLLPVVLPVVGILSLVIVARDGGNPFFRQERVGRNGRIFHLVKLRTMVHDADAALNRYLEKNPDARDEWTRNQKLADDPRVTRCGRFLRASSLDELPQLWNVLVGDMSLVGPRPMMREQKALYPGRAYYSLRPGITGLWQISGRSRTSFAARASYDAQYLRSVSAVTDLGILLRTVGVVLRGTGR